MNIVQNKNFSIYVYSDDHPPPHCHVRFSDKTEITVEIPLIQPRYGAVIPKNVEKKIFDNLDKLSDAWEKLNRSKIKKKRQNDTME